MKKIGILVLFAFLIAYTVLRNLWQVEWYPMHDTTHVARVHLMRQTIISGQFPPVWADSANGGYGYPLFHVYAPLVYLLALVAKTFLPTYMIALKFVISLLTLIGIFGIYRLTAQRGALAQLISAFSFSLLPYGAVNIFVRGAYAEYASMMLLPWLFWIWSGELSSSKKMISAAGITAIFFLSHNLIPVITLPFLLVWIYFFQKNSFKKTLSTLMLSFVFSAWFILPLVFERGFMQVDSISRTTNYSLHFVDPSQLWNSTWGFGGSAPGVEDGISFKIGKLQLVLAFLGFLTLLKTKVSRNLSLLLGGFLAFALYMTTSGSRIIWDNLPTLGIVQFPWRFLTLIGFFVSLLSSYSLGLVPKLLRLPALVTTCAFLVYFNAKYFAPQSNLTLSDSAYLTGPYVSETLATIVPEYLPSWSRDFSSTSGSLLLSGDVKDLKVSSSTNSHTLYFSSNSAQEISLAKSYYPTWKAVINGTPARILPGKNGQVTLQIPAGKITLTMTQGNTLLQRASLGFSLIGLLYFFPVALRGRRYA